MSVISIENMRFYAHHGCFDQEQTIGTNFLVSIYFEVNTDLAEETDDIDDTVDYSKVYAIVKEQMSIPSHLLERVGRRIIDKVEEEFASVKNIRLKISKLNPPVGGQMDCVSVELNT